MGKIIVLLLGIILVGYTISANKTSNRLRKEQNIDWIQHDYRDKKGFEKRTKIRKDHAKETWELQDCLCWIFWIAVVLFAIGFFG